jgi:hypothetical protein
MRASLRPMLIYFALLGMAACWLFAIFTLANNSVDNRISVPGLLLIFLLAFFSTRALETLNWHPLALGSLSWLMWAVVTLLSIKFQLFGLNSFLDTAWLTAFPEAVSQIFYSFQPALLIFLGSIPLWWLGKRLAQSEANFTTSVGYFQFGLIILVIVFFSSYELSLISITAVPVIITFFVFSLAGISIAHAQSEDSWLSSWQGNWTGMLLISIGIIILIGLLISIIFTPDLIQVFLNILKWIWGVIEKVMTWIASLFPPPAPASPIPGLDTAPGATPEETTIPLQIPENLLSGMRLAWTILSGGILVLAIWRVSSQIFGFMRRRAAQSGGEIETLKGAFMSDFLTWIRRILTTVFHIRFGERIKSRPLPPEVASVRQLYGQFLHWAASGGYPRGKAQTPSEFEFVLSDAISENQPELEFITREYINARYGPVTPTQEDLNRLKESWKKLKQARLKASDSQSAQMGVKK